MNSCIKSKLNIQEHGLLNIKEFPPMLERNDVDRLAGDHQQIRNLSAKERGYLWNLKRSFFRVSSHNMAYLYGWTVGYWISNVFRAQWPLCAEPDVPSAPTPDSSPWTCFALHQPPANCKFAYLSLNNHNGWYGWLLKMSPRDGIVSKECRFEMISLSIDDIRI